MAETRGVWHFAHSDRDGVPREKEASDCGWPAIAGGGTLVFTTIRGRLVTTVVPTSNECTQF